MSDEFYCGGCGKHKPVQALAETSLTGTKRCGACVELMKHRATKKGRAALNHSHKNGRA